MGTELNQQREWELLAIFRVEWTDRVQCQCNGCGQTIYAAIHMIRLPDGELQCWGSDCYRRERGHRATHDLPTYSALGGRPLTPEEREMLLTNRDQLIARFEADQQARVAAEEEAHRRLEDARRSAFEAHYQFQNHPVPYASLVPEKTVDAPPEDDSGAQLFSFDQKLICVFCGQTTSEWWCKLGTSGQCKCKACLRAGRSR